MEYYRNKIDVISKEGIFVDAESLWKLEGEMLILVDEDQYVSFPFSESKFYKVTL